MSQLPDPIAHLDAHSQKIYDAICAKRGGHHWSGLFPSLMNYPELAQKFSDWSAFLRFDAVLKPCYREFAILSVGARLHCSYEFDTHLSYARQAGLDEELIDQIAKKDFANIKEPVYQDISKAVEILLQIEVMPQDLQNRLVKSLGLQSVIQLSILIGWYRMLAALAIAYEFKVNDQ